MLPSGGDLVPLALSFAVPAGVLLLLMPRYIRLLEARGRTTGDVHKAGQVRVPTPAGPLIVVSLLAGELVAWAFYGKSTPLVLIAVVSCAGAIGLYDDLREVGGVVKPVLLAGVGLLVALAELYNPRVYDPVLYFPLFTQTGTHYIIFALIVIASIPVSANAFNMLDAFNGEISGFTAIVSAALVIGIVLRSYALPDTSAGTVAAALPLLAVSGSFYVFNRYPSRVFDGNSGSLSFGAMYVILSILGGVEIAALVALIPAVINSYYILSSVRGLVERKRMAARPTFLGEDMKLHASTDPHAPTTLVRMILLGGALDERTLVNRILAITLYAAFLSVVTSAMTWLL